jgi:Na+/H+-translocating membrane pyrophosphatase
VLTISIPVVVKYTLSNHVLSGVLVGSTVVGVLLALLMANVVAHGIMLKIY